MASRSTCQGIKYCAGVGQRRTGITAKLRRVVSLIVSYPPYLLKHHASRLVERASPITRGANATLRIHRRVISKVFSESNCGVRRWRPIELSKREAADERSR